MGVHRLGYPNVLIVVAGMFMTAAENPAFMSKWCLQTLIAVPSLRSFRMLTGVDGFVI